jgi:hypothetical protein
LTQRVGTLHLRRQDFYLVVPVIFINHLHNSIQQAFSSDVADNNVGLSPELLGDFSS